MDNSTWSLLGSAVTSYAQSQATVDAGVASAGAYGVQAAQSERAAEYATYQAEINNLNLQRMYNETAASQAVVFAAQGRSFSSGSIQNIMSSDQEALEWDKMYNISEAEKAAEGYMIDAQGYRSAGSTAVSSAKKSSSLGLLSTGLSIASAIW